MQKGFAMIELVVLCFGLSFLVFAGLIAYILKVWP